MLTVAFKILWKETWNEHLEKVPEWQKDRLTELHEWKPPVLLPFAKETERYIKLLWGKMVTPFPKWDAITRIQSI